MDSAIKRGLGPPSGRHAFDPIQTDAAITHTDPYLVLVAILLMFLWWRMSFGPGSYGNRNSAGPQGTELREGYGSSGYFRV
mmetsp:Transcript_90038/g.134923  ORF Transcript_90038/g.134923 Transcript_90038/m.134923 type:complete len:81 (+) Transcript_90038:58-300(+)